MTTINYFPSTLQSPSNDSSDSYLITQLKKTTGPQFEKHLGGFFKYQGYQVELTKPSRDKGADLIVTCAWEKKVIQAKQWKEHVGVRAIQEVYAAQKNYDATHALVITTSQFTKPAIELANKLGVECWDGERLLKELYKYQYFYPPE